ncbi:MAG: DUF4417 domain-containing protein [Deltaproteobacteria bacterium]|nr:DUF4417 domain-containing protein [Deltaproteobacteria bacterium]
MTVEKVSRVNLGLMDRHLGKMKLDKMGVPVMAKSRFIPEDLLAFNACLTSRRRNRTVHFFIEDYRFERIWPNVDRYGKVLAKYQGAFSPDFSMYGDMPYPFQVWNLFRNRFCGAYWQTLGIEVVPTVAWADESTFEWCFSGLVKGTNVAVSTIGVLNEDDYLNGFEAGFRAMVEIVKPRTILVYGRKYPGELPGKIRYYPYSFDNNHRRT